MAEFIILLVFIKFFLSVAAYTLYLVCWYFIRLIDFIINGSVLTNRLSPLKTAHVGRIWWRKTFVTKLDASPLDFICLFNKRVRPDYVLQPNISLYAITDKEAIFVETSDQIDIYSSDVHPFFLPAQFLNATNVIAIPITDFVRLAEKIGDPIVPVLWMSSTGRCGGTLLSQMFESVPGTQLIHQPDAPTSVYALREYNKINDDDFEVILKSMIRILCKPHPGTERICIKTRPPCTNMITDISKVFPGILQFFIYRNSMETISSYTAVASSNPYGTVMRTCADTAWLSKMCPFFRNKQVHILISKRYGRPAIPYDISTVCVLAYAWAIQISFVRDAISKGHNILPVKYEDMIARPQEIVGELFKVMAITDTHLARALTGLGRDSQRGSDLSRSKIKKATNCMLSEDKIKVDDILSKYNLPPIGQDYRI